MSLKQLKVFWRSHGRLLIILAAIVGVIAWTFLHKLGSLTPGLSTNELGIATSSLGWHGIWHQPMDIFTKLLRSTVYFVFKVHNRLIIRLPDVLIGLGSIGLFASLIKLWHGTRTTILATALYAFGAWTLHLSRLASDQTIYLLLLPLLLFQESALKKYNRVWTLYLAAFSYTLVLTVPGGIWLAAWLLFWQRTSLLQAWKATSSIRQRLITGVLGLIWLPVMILDFIRQSKDIVTWLGLPQHWQSPLALVKAWAAVFVHLFVHGPKNPELWLGKAPILDAFTLIICLLGIAFYVQRYTAGRSKLLGGFLLIGSLLVAIGGTTGLTVLVPLLYILAATGLTYLLHIWFNVFPLNPIARGLSVGFVAVAVALACFYNLRAYFVAWSNSPDTSATFTRHL